MFTCIVCSSNQTSRYVLGRWLPEKMLGDSALNLDFDTYLYRCVLQILNSDVESGRPLPYKNARRPSFQSGC